MDPATKHTCSGQFQSTGFASVRTRCRQNGYLGAWKRPTRVTNGSGGARRRWLGGGGRSVEDVGTRSGACSGYWKSGTECLWGSSMVMTARNARSDNVVAGERAIKSPKSWEWEQLLNEVGNICAKWCACLGWEKAFDIVFVRMEVKQKYLGGLLVLEVHSTTNTQPPDDQHKENVNEMGEDRVEVNPTVLNITALVVRPHQDVVGHEDPPEDEENSHHLKISNSHIQYHGWPA
ncbi:hypothetical protein BDV93DRAFT_514198 [Ceratobasidium sp. AG-I]|nr:hypothetical protein BDV93DRAFT_514198 [Ceratobasidium sp. AG-I]